MIKFFILFSILQSPSMAKNKNALDGVRCGDDITKIIERKTFPQGKVKALEKAYQSIGLKFNGGGPIEEAYFVNSITICKKEYLLLFDEKNKKNDDLIMAVLEIPSHSKEEPMFSYSTCKKQGKNLENVYGIFQDRSKNHLLYAWQIDLEKMNFTSLLVEDLDCSGVQLNTTGGI